MITVNRLVRDCGIEMSFLAGEAGSGRPLSWAHVIDRGDPWNWIDRGELILTTGVGIPVEAAQADWMTKVIDSGANGLVLASGPETVGIGPQALECAEAADFPVLSASFTAKFTELAKEVINVALQEDAQRLAAAQRLFTAYSMTLTRREPFGRQLAGVAERAQLRFVVRDVAGEPVFANSELGEATETVALDSWADPLRLRLGLEGGGGELVGPSLRYTFALLTGIELHRRIERERERNVVLDAQVATMVGAGIDDDLAVRAALGARLDLDRRIVVIALGQGASPDTGSFDLLRLSPHLWDMPVVTLVHRGTPLILAEDGDASLRAVASALGESGAGVSNAWGGGLAFAEAVMQARCAAREVSIGLRRFSGLDPLVGVLPMDIEAQREFAGRVLGPIRAYDAAHGTQLLMTLEVYYTHDRSPGRTAEALFIHRHTLSYRLGTIEKVVGMNPNATSSIVHLGAALEASHTTG